MRQPETTQNPPDGAAMNIDTVGVGQLGDQLIERDLALGGDARLDPTGHLCQLAVSTTIPLGPRLKRSGFTPQLDQFVHEFRRHPEMTRRLAVSMALIDKRDNTRSQLYWMWLAHL